MRTSSAVDNGSRMMRLRPELLQPQPRRFASSRRREPFSCLAGGAEALEQRRADQHVGGRDVGGQRNVAHVADTEQRLDVRIMWVLVEWVDQEDDGIDLAFHDKQDRKSTRLNSSHANISYAV